MSNKSSNSDSGVPMKTATLTLISDLSNGFSCVLAIRNSDGKLLVSKAGRLPHYPELFQGYSKWLLAYEHQVGVVRNAKTRGPRWSVVEGETNIPNEQEAWEELTSYLNSWLDSNDFRELEEEFLKEIGRQESKLIIQTDDRNLWKLPWHEWRSLNPEATEFAFCRKDTTLLENRNRENGRIRALVILGDSHNINTQEDCAIVDSLPDLEKLVLNQPNLESVCNSLRDKDGFDILLFSGHSFSRGDSGLISLDNGNAVEIRRFRRALREATEKGLKLAIFNSCESLSFGQELAQLVPRTILMKESVPDDFAQEFLRVFFRHFAGGDSFIVAVRRTRAELEYFDARYPAVTFIPTNIQAYPEEPQLFWSDLGRRTAGTTSLGKETTLHSETLIQITVRVLKKSTLPILGIAVFAGAGLWGMKNIKFPIPVAQQTSSPNVAQTSNTQIPDFLLPLPQTISEIKFPQGEFNYGGSTSFNNALDELSKKILNSSNLKTKFTYLPAMEGHDPGSNFGISELLQTDSKLHVALSSRSLDDPEKAASLAEIPVAIDGIAIVVNSEVNISRLTLDQLQQIYSGEKRNWRDFGGPDLRITSVARKDEAGGTVEVFEKKVMKGKRMRNSVSVTSTRDGLQTVESTPGAIYFGTASEVVPKCNVIPVPLSSTANDHPIRPYLGDPVSRDNCPKQRNQINTKAFTEGSYPLTRPLFIVIKRDGQLREQVGIAYAKAFLSKEGQEILSTSGFGKIIR